MQECRNASFDEAFSCDKSRLQTLWKVVQKGKDFGRVWLISADTRPGIEVLDTRHPGSADNLKVSRHKIKISTHSTRKDHS